MNPLQYNSDAPVSSFDNFDLPAGAPDTTPPEITAGTWVSATGITTNLVLYFNEALDTSSVPAVGDFETHIGTYRDRRDHEVSSPAAVAVSGNSLTLTLGQLQTGKSAYVWYTPGTNPLRDAAGNAAAAFQKNYLANSFTSGSFDFQSATVNGNRLTLAFNRPLDAGSVPAASAFSFHSTLFAGERDTLGLVIDSVRISGTDVVLVLENPVPPCSSLTVSYAKPSTNPIQNIRASGQARSFQHRTVTNALAGRCMRIR